MRELRRLDFSHLRQSAVHLLQGKEGKAQPKQFVQGERTEVSLALCPFCGSSDIVITLYNHPSAVCQKCWAIGPKGPRLDEFTDTNQARKQAAELWNKRTENGTSARI